MRTFVIRSGERDEKGTVLHTVSIDGKIQSLNLDFDGATDLVHFLAMDGDIIQEADGDKEPYHERVYPETE